MGKNIAVDIALCWVMSDAGLRRSKTDATPRTVYLTPVAMAHLDAMRTVWESATVWKAS